MKKQYIDPNTEIIAVTPYVILSASTPDVTIDNGEDTIEAEEVESRRRKDIWDDEEDVEEKDK